MISILLADDHDLMRLGIRTLLEANPDFEVCGEAKDGIEALDKAVEMHPDVVVLDVSMPNMNGFVAARQIRSRLPDTQILVFTVHHDAEMVHEMIEAGALGYVLKSDAANHLAAAVQAVAQKDLYFSSGISNIVVDSMTHSSDWKTDSALDDLPLTAREVEIVKLLARGKRNKEIATALFISVRTVETHRRTIHRKLEINSAADLVRYAIRHRLIRP